MRIDFKIISQDEEELKLEIPFCENLITLIKDEINNYISSDKLNFYKKAILNTSVISWKNKPEDINMRLFLNDILDELAAFKNNNDTYTIRFRDTCLKNTNTKVDLIARFLDKGNEEYSGVHIFSAIFNKYSNVNNYWEFFVMSELGRFPNSEVLVIK